MSYVCYHSRTSNVTEEYGLDENGEDTYMNGFKEIAHKRGKTHFLIIYTNQSSGGQSGGPVILRENNKDIPFLIGIHVSGDQVSLDFVFYHLQELFNNCYLLYFPHLTQISL